MTTWINNSVSRVMEAAGTALNTVTKTPPGAKLLLLMIPSVAAFPNGTIVTTPLFIGLASGLTGLTLLGAVGVGVYCLYKKCAQPIGEYSIIENKPVAEGELEEDEAARLLFFHRDEQDGSSVAFSRQVTPLGSLPTSRQPTPFSSKPVSDDDEGKGGELEIHEMLSRWGGVYDQPTDSPFATDDDSASTLTTNRFGIQDTPAKRVANG